MTLPERDIKTSYQEYALPEAVNSKNTVRLLSACQQAGYIVYNPTTRKAGFKEMQIWCLGYM